MLNKGWKKRKQRVQVHKSSLFQIRLHKALGRSRSTLGVKDDSFSRLFCSKSASCGIKDLQRYILAWMKLELNTMMLKMLAFVPRLFPSLPQPTVIDNSMTCLTTWTYPGLFGPEGTNPQKLQGEFPSCFWQVGEVLPWYKLHGPLVPSPSSPHHCAKHRHFPCRCSFWSSLPCRWSLLLSERHQAVAVCMLHSPSSLHDPRKGVPTIFVLGHSTCMQGT